MHNNQILGEENLSVLRSLQEIYKDKRIIIAGGAVRDFVMGKPYRDIDIWIPEVKKGQKAFTLEAVIPQQLEFGDDDNISSTPLDLADQPRDNPYEDVKGILSVHDMYYKGTQYQLIFVPDNPKELVENHFDFGFCRIFHDGHKIHTTKAFETDRDNKTLTYDISTMDRANIEKIEKVRGPKLLKKYPDFTLIKVGKKKSSPSRIVNLKDVLTISIRPQVVQIGSGDYRGHLAAEREGYFFDELRGPNSGRFFKAGQIFPSHNWIWS